MTSSTTQSGPSPIDVHRTQRALVAASLLVCPRGAKPTHRRWA
jgi:hypothetical protein